ncbi:MAG: FG-GAP-like repeat-containing protein [Candidatus Eisenbacteria bacterium]|nr:FG-GAP-like repeat-containing protein [Candidatus Eisenbacteria bacterium]
MASDKVSIPRSLFPPSQPAWAFKQGIPPGTPFSRSILEKKRMERKLAFEKKGIHLTDLQLSAFPETLRVLGIRVEFQEDNDPHSTGNGKMDFVGYGDPLLPDGGKNLLYDPPHTKIYFERQFDALRNYYQAVSGGRLRLSPDTTWEGGKLEIIGTVMPAAESLSYTLPHPLGYYSDYGQNLVSGDGYRWGFGLGALLVDAIYQAEQDVPSFKAYDGIVLFHAGSMLQVSGSFLPYPPYDLPAVTIFDFQPPLTAHAGADTIWGGSIVAEKARFEDVFFGIQGTLCHEFGHQLGLPDLYDVSYQSVGVGEWDLMSDGGYLGQGFIPGQPSAWVKKFLGWVTPRKIDSAVDSTITLRAVELYHPDSSVVQIPVNGHEYFLIENRQSNLKGTVVDTVFGLMKNGVLILVDEYDAFLPGSGLLIWHIDEDIIYGNFQEVQAGAIKGVDLEEADGIQDLEYWRGSPYDSYGSPFDPFFLGNNRSFGDATVPNSKTNNGAFTYISVSDISRSDTLMTFRLNTGWRKRGFPVESAGAFTMSSPAFYDLDGDGKPEVVSAASDGRVYAWRPDGSKFIANSDSLSYYVKAGRDSALIKVPLAVIGETSGAVFSSVSIADIDGDGIPEICTGDTDGKLYVWKAKDADSNGRADSLSGFPVKTDGMIVSSPLLSDLDGDGKMEIIWGSDDSKLHACDFTGAVLPGFPVYLGREVRATPSSYDIDVNGKKEIIAVSGDGRVFFVKMDGTQYPGSPHLTPRLGLASSSPSIGDIDRDNVPEIIFITPENTLTAVKISGAVAAGWPVSLSGDPFQNLYVIPSPALGDVNNDGFLDVVVASGKKLYAFNHNGTHVTGFPIEISSSGEISSSPIIVDVDGGLGIIVGSPDGLIHGFKGDGKKLPGFPLTCGGPVNSTPVFGDLDGNGKQELGAGSDDGFFYLWELPLNSAGKSPWPTFLQNSARRGYYPDSLFPSPKVLPESPLVENLYCYPNPTSAGTKIRFFLNKNATIEASVLTVSGGVVWKETRDFAGATDNEFAWDGTKAVSGLYLVRVEARSGGKKEVYMRKLAILR